MILERVFALYLLLILRKRIKLRDQSSHFSHFQGKSSHLRALYSTFSTGWIKYKHLFGMLFWILGIK